MRHGTPLASMGGSEGLEQGAYRTTQSSRSGQLTEVKGPPLLTPKNINKMYITHRLLGKIQICRYGLTMQWPWAQTAWPQILAYRFMALGKLLFISKPQALPQ